jgi:peptidoglycan hydrolase-like protein with peptidoglycan-binding domain
MSASNQHLMKVKVAVAIVLASVATIRADDTIAKVQQALKDQGFYYGEVTGEKNTATNDAIRRYQIRSGLQITGELNDETLRSLQSSASASPSPFDRAIASTAPSPNGDTSDLRDEPAAPGAGAPVRPLQPFNQVPPDRQPDTPNGRLFTPSPNGLFAGTPYETAPPDVQRRVIVDAQRRLARRGLFKGEIDGSYGAPLEFSLRAYQTRTGLPPTGRLDLETLAALRLLPGAQMPVWVPNRGMRGPPVQEPPVRGEWVRP